MIISHKFKFVFISIPKTGCQFVGNIIKELDPSSTEEMDFEGIRRSGHIMFSEIEQLDIYENIKSYSFFTLIRNPVERYISHYNFILSEEEIHYLFPEIKDKSFYQSTSVSSRSLGLMINFVKDMSGKINKNIRLLHTNNLNFDLLNFLSDIGVPDDDLEKIKPFMKKKVNASKKFFDKEDLDISNLSFNDFHIEDLLFYLSAQ